MSEISVATINVLGLCNPPVRHKVFTWLNEFKLKIIFLQETNCTKAFESSFNSYWNGKIIHNHTDSSHSRGVCIMFHESLNVDIIDTHCSDDGRLLLLNVKMFDQIFCLVNVYAHNIESNRKQLFEKLKKWILQFSKTSSNIIVGGDFNTCLRDIDREPKTHLKDSSRSKLNNIITNLKLIDTWASKHTNKNGFTYLDKRCNTKSRLDYLFMSEKLLDINYRSNIIQSFNKKQIDHDLVVTKVYINTRPKGSGYWKFNSQLLNNSEYCNDVKNVIKETCTEYKELNNHQLIWEMVKINVKEMTIHFASKLSRENKSYISDLQNQLNSIQQSIDNSDQSNLNGLLTEKNAVQEQLDSELEIKSKGAFIRSRAKWQEEGEKCTQYFFNLEKQIQNQNIINKLTTTEGNSVTNDNEILETASCFYENLYKSKNISKETIDDYFTEINVEYKLNEKEKETCDNIITEQELQNVINNLKPNKAPGLDGLTSEFYGNFWDDLKLPFLNMINDSFNKGIMPDSMRKAVITLLFKKGRSDLIQNYRPISLTNYDYKILAFTLSTRMQSVISKLISNDQSAYIRNRYIGNNARFLQDIINLSENYDLPCALISLDFEKAFDSLDWKFMIECLKKYNFGENFIKWINILYNKPSMIIKNNGHFSRSISLFTGIRQGCPVSALIFILAMEVLSNKIKCNNNIKGFICNGKEHKVSMYADDANIVISDINSIEFILSIINDFSCVAGPKLNTSKTECIMLGPLKLLNINNIHGINVTSEPIKCLGLYLGTNSTLCEQLNWNKKIDLFENTLLNWKRRKLSLFGKVTVINMLAISKLIYNFTLLHVPEWVIDRIEKSITNFLWQNRDRINRNCIIANILDGGLNLVDVKCKIAALKATWISRWISSAHLLAWHNSASMILKKISLNLDIMTSFNVFDASSIPELSHLPLFYYDVFSCYIKCKGVKMLENMNSSEFLSNPIWGNTLINKKCIYYKTWLDSGFTHVKDLFDENGSFVSENYVLSKLTSKRNWMVEYLNLKKSILKIVTKYNFNTDLSKYININNNSNHFIFDGKNKVSILNIKSKLFYNILLNKKITPHYMKKRWQCIFEIKLLDEDWSKN